MPACLGSEYIVTNNGHKDIKVVTGGRANFNPDFNKIHKESTGKYCSMCMCGWYAYRLPLCFC